MAQTPPETPTREQLIAARQAELAPRPEDLALDAETLRLLAAGISEVEPSIDALVALAGQVLNPITPDQLNLHLQAKNLQVMLGNVGHIAAALQRKVDADLKKV